MHTQHQSLFTLWRRVKSFSQALGCRVIDFPDPESQKGFVYLQSLFLSLFLSTPLPLFDSYTWLFLSLLSFLPFSFPATLRFYPSPFRSSVCFTLFPLSASPVFTLRRLFPRGVESSRVESGFGARRRYGRIVKIGHWPKTSIFRLFHRPENEKETERYRQFLLEERVDAMARNWGREGERERERGIIVRGWFRISGERGEEKRGK